jgi:type IV pilus assembly protein PilX
MHMLKQPIHPMPRQALLRVMHAHARRGSQRHDRGVILPLTLVVLLVLVTAGTVAARNAALSEQVSNNFRTSNVAFQAAEIGIRYCESLAIAITNDPATASFTPTEKNAVPAKTVTITSPSDSVAVWRTRANWLASTSLVTVPAVFFKPANTQVDSGVELSNAPRCMVERLPSATSERFLVTAWGRSNDSTINALGQLTNGSESWLQSVLKKPPTP